MIIEEVPGGIILRNVNSFNLNHIFDCGQCFRWIKNKDGSYTGVAMGKVIKLTMQSNDVTIFNTNLKDYFEIWQNYFDMEHDYVEFKNKIAKDDIMKKAIKAGEGIRILRQDSFEALISFIISASNNIPRIMKIVDSLCREFGQPVEFENKIYYTFPSPEMLCGVTEEKLAPIKAGFRAKYIVDAVQKVLSGEVNLEAIKTMPALSARAELMKINGVGPKVADCTLIFGFGRLDVFPVDTWIDKAMKKLYPSACENVKVRDAGVNLFGDICGLAQQYIFYYARENKI